MAVDSWIEDTYISEIRSIRRIKRPHKLLVLLMGFKGEGSFGCAHTVFTQGNRFGEIISEYFNHVTTYWVNEPPSPLFVALLSM